MPGLGCTGNEVAEAEARQVATAQIERSLSTQQAVLLGFEVAGGQSREVEDGQEQVSRNENQDHAPADSERYPCRTAHLATAVMRRKLT